MRLCARSKPAVWLSLLLSCSAWGETPLGTAFTYQGRLVAGGGPANGPYDFQFALYDGAGGSGLVGGPVDVDDFVVSSGLFTVTLDFGPAIFTGNERWLEIRVRPGSGSGPDPYTTLAPRQPLAAGPNSLYAKLAGSVADGAVGSDQIADFSIMAQDIADGVVVRSLNGESGGVFLLGTNGISVSAAVGGPVTVTSSATPFGSIDTIVQRDATGSFAAQNLTLEGSLAVEASATVSEGLTVGGNLELPNGALTKNGFLFAHGTGTNNTFVGLLAGGHPLLTGANNSGFGFNALGLNTIGVENAAFGAEALAFNQGGFFNAAFGALALRGNTSGNENAAFGHSALKSNTSGFANSAFGHSALQSNTSGFDNSAFGQGALSQNTASGNSAFGAMALGSNNAGFDNSAFGAQALGTNISGTGNSAFGSNAMAANGGASNTAMGASALAANTTGEENSAFGKGALANNTTGFGNSAFGFAALGANTSVGNAAFGYKALEMTTGASLSAFGYFALAQNTSGAQNSAFGYLALYNNQTGISNSAFGYGALAQNNAHSNSAFGMSALVQNSSGQSNSAFGQLTMANNTIGGANAAFGIEALQGNSEGSGNSAFGAFALDSATGFLNTAVGNGAGMDLTGGDNNIYLGAFSGPSGPSAESNTIRIGLSTHTATYVGGIFNAAVSGGPVHVDVNGRLGLFASSRRYKQEIADMGGESDVLQRLRPVSFYYRPEHDDSHQRQYGLIAEEVAEVAPQLVVYDAAGRPQTVAYHLVNAMLLNEVQKQRKLVEGQRQTIERQQALLEELAARLARVEAATIGGGSQP